MNLKKELRQAGYDLIDGPIRNHKPLQLWLKKPFNAIELYYEHVTHALTGKTDLNIVEDSALRVTYNQKQNYKFNIGITVLDDILTSLGLGNLGLNTSFSSGKQVTLSYNNSKTVLIPQGELSHYLSNADFNHPNKDFLRNANRDNIIIISGVLLAKDLKATIETTSDIDANLELELNSIADGKVSFTKTSNNELEMISEGNAPFPIAVKANRIDWDKGEFNKMTLITDNRYYF